jgi:succinoglycan biosynthesis transport protein ExoP
MISILDIVAAVRDRLRLALAVAAAVFVVIFGVAMLQPRQYTASSSILVDLSQTDPTNDEQVSNAPVTDSIIGTQVDVISSAAVLEEVARKSGMAQDPKLGETPQDRIQTATGIMRRQLSVNTGKGSNVIRLAYTSTSPEYSANIVNQIVDVFLVKQVDLRADAAQSNAKWLEDRTKDVQKRLETAQARLSDYQRKNGIVGVDRMDLEGDATRNLTTQLVQAQADAAEANSHSGAVNDPEVAKSTIVQDLEREAGIQSGKVAELSKTLGPNHPTMVAANAQLSALRSELATSRAAQTRSLTSASSSANRRENELRTKLALQQQKMIGLSELQDQLVVLQRDVDAAQKSYDTVRQRYNEATLKSSISQANASRLDRASAPLLPSKPNLLLWFVAAVFLGLFAGFGLVAGFELLQPRVRTASGTARMADIEVIADLTQAADRRRRSTLLAQGESA